MTPLATGVGALTASSGGGVVAAGSELEQAPIYDARTGTVIEALSPEVREVPLASLLDRNQHAIVVRPLGLSSAERVASVDRARQMVGVSFDYAGLFGLDSGARFYCSELLYWAAGLDREARPLVVTPAKLMDYGEVIYYSGKREDPRLQDAARLSRRRARDRGPTRAAAL